MRRIIQTFLYTAIICLGITKSSAQTENPEGGGGFAVDGLNYTFTNTPNEVRLVGGTFTNPFIIPSSVVFEDPFSNPDPDPEAIFEAVTYNVVGIGFGAFDNNPSLTSVTIPATIRDIRGNAFDNTGLTEVIALGATPAAIFSSSFGDRSTINLTVPVGAEETYLNNGWEGFASINGTATSFVVDTIIYGINSLAGNTVSVIGGASIISGSLTIPETVIFNGTVYTITKIVDEAFQYNQITTVMLPNTLTTLGSSAFRDNQLTSINIPSTLTVLEHDVLKNNNLTSITIPDGITSLGNAFIQNNNLTSITIPASVTEIDPFAFTANPITAVEVLSDPPPSISTFAFTGRSTIDLTVPTGTEAAYEAAGWTGFNSVNGIINFQVGSTFTENNFNYRVTSLAPNEVEITGGTSIPLILDIDANVSNSGSDFTVVAIGNVAFRDKSITSLTVPNSVRIIGDNAFRDNELQSLTLPNSIISIGAAAFLNNQLMSITLPENVATIGQNSFRNNPLTEVIALGINPPSVTTGNNDSFNNRVAIDLTVPDGTEAAYVTAGWTGFNSINGVITLSVGSTFTENNFDYEVTSVNPNEVAITGGTAFPNDLIIDATVSSQGETFTVTSVGVSAFEDGTLTSVQLPNTIRLIDNLAFQNNQIIGSLIIPNSVTTINFRAFRFNQIESVIIPNSVTILGNAVFEVNALTSLTISENLTSIGNQVFRNNQLATVTIPANINSLGDNCFRDNPLTEVIVLNTAPPTLSSSDPFLNSRGNIALTVPSTTELEYLTNSWIGFATINGQDAAVFNEFEVANITYKINKLNPNEVETVDTSLTGALTIPSTVNDGTLDYTITAIGDNSFRDKQLTSVTIPNGITNIGADAFRDNELTSVVIPASVTGIDTRGFRDNPLTTIITEGFTPLTINNQSNNSNHAFTNRSNIDVFVQSGTVQAHTDAGWIGFKSVTEASKALQLKVFLQGASLNPITGEETLMRDDLRMAVLIPFMSPYGDGLEIFDTIFVEGITGPDAIVDWIFIELRDPFNNTIIIESRSALLQRDGDIVDMDAVSPIQFTATPDDYFITIKHRNHLGIMLANAKRLSPVITIIDFADANNQITFGSNAQTDAGMPTDTLGMWTGNVNGDNIVQYSGTDPDAPAILSLVLNDVGNFLNFSTFIVNGYNTNDVNMDGKVQYEGVSPDAPFILQNVLAHPGNFLNFSTFQIQEQLPEN